MVSNHQPFRDFWSETSPKVYCPSRGLQSLVPMAGSLLPLWGSLSVVPVRTIACESPHSGMGPSAGPTRAVSGVRMRWFWQEPHSGSPIINATEGLWSETSLGVYFPYGFLQSSTPPEVSKVKLFWESLPLWGLQSAARGLQMKLTPPRVINPHGGHQDKTPPKVSYPSRSLQASLLWDSDIHLEVFKSLILLESSTPLRVFEKFSIRLTSTLSVNPLKRLPIS